jgi:uncharacterized protein (UPF0332 family)
MREKTERFLLKAEEAIEAAEILRREGKYDFAAGRAYYAMFYTAEGLLCERDLEFSKHGGVHAAFGEHFAKTNQMEPKFHRWLLDGFRSRLQADYGIETPLGDEAAETLIAQAREFLQAAREYLKSD